MVDTAAEDLSDTDTERPPYTRPGGVVDTAAEDLSDTDTERPPATRPGGVVDTEAEELSDADTERPPYPTKETSNDMSRKPKPQPTVFRRYQNVDFNMSPHTTPTCYR